MKIDGQDVPEDLHLEAARYTMLKEESSRLQGDLQRLQRLREENWTFVKEKFDQIRAVLWGGRVPRRWGKDHIHVTSETLQVTIVDHAYFEVLQGNQVVCQYHTPQQGTLEYVDGTPWYLQGREWAPHFDAICVHLDQWLQIVWLDRRVQSIKKQAEDLRSKTEGKAFAGPDIESLVDPIECLSLESSD